MSQPRAGLGTFDRDLFGVGVTSVPINVEQTTIAIPVGGYRQADFFIVFTHNMATAVEGRFDASNDGGTTWHEIPFEDAAVPPTVTTATKVLSRPVSANSNWVWELRQMNYGFIRTRIIGVGANPGDLIEIPSVRICIY